MPEAMITVYARREPTADSLRWSLPGYPFGKRDVQVYRDAECTNPFARIPWHYSSCPRRAQKTIVLNCYRWRLQWVPDLAPAAAA